MATAAPKGVILKAALLAVVLIVVLKLVASKVPFLSFLKAV